MGSYDDADMQAHLAQLKVDLVAVLAVQGATPAQCAAVALARALDATLDAHVCARAAAATFPTELLRRAERGGLVASTFKAIQTLCGSIGVLGVLGVQQPPPPQPPLDDDPQ